MCTSDDVNALPIRKARAGDLAVIREIYNQGIEDRIATLDEEPKSVADLEDWFERHAGPYGVLLAERCNRVVGWASLNAYSHRCAYRGVAELSVYVTRGARGTGVGTALLRAIERHARLNDVHKIVLFALTMNAAGQRLYRKLGYRHVGVFQDQGRLDGRFVDVAIMEKLLQHLPDERSPLRRSAGRSAHEHRSPADEQNHDCGDHAQ